MEEVKTENTADNIEQEVTDGEVTTTPDKKEVVKTDTTEQAKEPKTETTKVATEKVPSPVQARIDRMYARLQAEREARRKAEAQTDVLKMTKSVEEDTGIEDEEKKVVGLTEADVERILAREKRDGAMRASEVRVLERHPTALNEDGSFDMSDPFVQKYIEIGRKNPELAYMLNGPELAEAMTEKELGLDYKKGRIDEAKRTTQSNNSFTASSTTAISRSGASKQLSPVEQKIARRMNMTDEQYVASRGSNKVSQKSWEVKVK